MMKTWYEEEVVVFMEAPIQLEYGGNVEDLIP